MMNSALFFKRMQDENMQMWTARIKLVSSVDAYLALVLYTY